MSNPNTYLLFAYCFSDHKFRSHELNNIPNLQSIVSITEYSTVFTPLYSEVQCLVWLWQGRSRSPNSWQYQKSFVPSFAILCDPICDLGAKFPDLERFYLRRVIFLWCWKWMWSITWCNVFILSINFAGALNPQSNMKCHY